MTAPTEPDLPKAKPWYMKWWAWLIAAVILIGGIGNILGLGSDEAPAETTDRASEQIEIPDVAGLPGKKAIDSLSSLGFAVRYDGDDETVVAVSNWDAVGTDPTAGTLVEEGSEVTLKLERATERLEAEQAERDAETAARNAEYAQTQLEIGEAQILCERYADAQFPFGIKLHTVVGKLAEEKTETGWFLKYEATATNEYNAEQSLNVECHMSGTNGAPVMEEFLAY